MAKYGSFKYGEQTYGVAAPTALEFMLEVDWNGDGVYDGEIAQYLNAVTITRGRAYYIKQDGSGFERLEVGKLAGVLNNTDKRFNVERLSSPYYPYIPVGKMARLKVTTPSNHEYALFTGLLENLVPDSKMASTARITAEDGVRLLKQEVSEAVQTSIRTDEALPLILDKVNWLWGTDLDIGIDVRNYWWLDRNSALDAIHDLADSEFGMIWIGADGTLKFRNRNEGIAPAAILADTDFLLGSIEISRPWEVVKNYIRINVYPPVLQTGVEIWKWQEAPLISGNASMTIFCSFVYGGQDAKVSNVTTPVAVTDYVFNSQPDGSGTDLTGNFSVTILAQFTGAAKVRITNNGATGGYPTLMRLRGDAITVPNATYVEEEDATSIAKFQRQPFELSIPWFQSTSIAQALANYMITFLAESRPTVLATMRGKPDVQFGLDLGDIVGLQIPESGINGMYRVAWMQHKSVDRNLRVWDSTFLFEPFLDLTGSYWTFPAEVGVTTKYA